MEELHADLIVFNLDIANYYRLPYFSEKSQLSAKSGHTSTLVCEQTTACSNTQAIAQAWVNLCVTATVRSIAVCRASPVNY